MKRLCFRRGPCRILLNPIPWVVAIAVYMLYYTVSFPGLYHPDTTTLGQPHREDEAVRSADVDLRRKGLGDDTKTESSQSKPEKRDSSPNVGDSLPEEYGHYTVRYHRGKTNDSQQSISYDRSKDGSSFDEVTPEIITGVTCKLGTRQALNSKFSASTAPVGLRAVEEELLGASLNDISRYVGRVRSIMRGMMHRHQYTRYINHDDFRTENEKGVEVGNYTYYAGGHWRPNDCEPRWKVAIVIPFRNRYTHLPVLLRNLVKLLKLQRLEFGIFVAEQSNDGIFNRGLLKNIGYVEATKFGWWDCVVFHDIDQIPMKGANYYGCDGMPRHLCARPEEMGFKPAYNLLFGGVVGVTAEQMERSNGYSNVYWGWGGEDDDLLKRLYKSGYKPTRDLREGYYKTLKHIKKTKTEMCEEVYCLLDTYDKRMAWDGINNVNYSSENLNLGLLYTYLSVDIKKESWNSGIPPCQKRDN